MTEAEDSHCDPIDDTQATAWTLLFVLFVASFFLPWPEKNVLNGFI